MAEALDENKMKVGAIAPWYGGKRAMAAEIVEELGPHTQYFEPFCGSMAVLFAKQPSQKETVNDLHGDLVNLARVLQAVNPAEELYDRLQRVLFSEDLLHQARKQLEVKDVEFLHGDLVNLARVLQAVNPAEELYDRLQRVLFSEDLLHQARKLLEMEDVELLLSDLDCSRPQNRLCIERAYWYFLACWMDRNGTAGTARLDYQVAVRWTNKGGSPTVRWRNAVESLPAWHRRLQNVVILNRDAFPILDRFEDCGGTAFHVDPPYPVETRSNGGTKGGGRSYLHEFKHDVDHARLAEILRGYREARIVLSSYDCPRIRELYDGWTFIDKTRQKPLYAMAGRGARKKLAPEVLIINGPSLARREEEQMSLFAAAENDEG